MGEMHIAEEGRSRGTVGGSGSPSANETLLLNLYSLLEGVVAVPLHRKPSKNQYYLKI